MKTERFIAEEYIREYLKYNEDDHSGIWFNQCLIHKATCQRFLEFLEMDGSYCGCDRCPSCNIMKKNKITDLKQAIKLYGDAGI